MKRNEMIVVAASFVVLLFIWPNFVHEPLHLIALKAQHSDGIIHFNWDWPAHPYIERTLPVDGIGGGMLYLLLPSVVSIILLILIASRRVQKLPYVSLAIYLGFDLIVNVLTHRTAISDFHFLVAVPGGLIIGYAIATIAMALTMKTLWVKINGQTEYGCERCE